MHKSDNILGIGTATSKYSNEYKIAKINYGQIKIILNVSEELCYSVSVFESENNYTIFRE